MKATDFENINNLKRTVEKNVGYQIKYAKNCDSLSEYIFEKTNAKVSSSTLKRFWQIIKSKYNPSKYTLNTLSILVGSTSWEHFCKNKKQKQETEAYLLLQEKFQNISKANINFIKKQNPKFFYEISKRDFAIEKMDAFLESDKKITSFVSNKAYGKTEIIVNLAERFFLSKKVETSKDLCLFINFETVNRTEKEDFNIYNLLKIILYEKDTAKLERKFIKILEGKRLVIFFNRICKIYKNETVFPRIIENIYSLLIGKLSVLDVKLIITCESDKWNVFEREFSQSDYIKEKWFDLNFNTLEKNKSNVPALSRNEIIEAIKREKKELNYSHILGNNKLIEIISIPYFLYIYISKFSEKDELCDELDLLQYYIKQEIFGDFYEKEKLSITEKMLDATNYGRVDKSIEKSVLNLSSKENIAFGRLLKLNFFNEYVSINNYFDVKSKVSFSNSTIYKYMIVNSWLRKFGLKLETVQDMMIYYKNNRQLKVSLLIWIIKIASKEYNLDIFKNIYLIINENFIKGNPRKLEERQIKTLIDTVAIELRKSKYLRKELFPFYLEQTNARDMYFRQFIDLDFLIIYYHEVIDYFLTSQVSKEDIFYSNTLLFWKYYLNNEINLAIKSLQILKKINKQFKNTVYSIIYKSCSIIYFQTTGKEVKTDTVIEIFTAFNEYNSYVSKYEQNFTFFIVLEALEISKNNELILEINNNNKLLKEDNFLNNNNYLLNFLNIFRARALISKDRTIEAFELLNNINSSKFPEGQKLYWKIKLNIALAEYFDKNKNNKSKELKLEIAKIAKTLKYQLYIKK